MNPIILLLLLFCGNLHAQHYYTSAGLRFGTDVGISVNQRLMKKSTIELLHQPGLFTSDSYTSITLRKHLPILGRSVNLFGGMGAAAYVSSSLNVGDLIQEISPAVVATAGGEIVIGRIHISYDWSPHLIMDPSIQTSRWRASNALSVKYVLLKPKSAVKRSKEKLFKNR